ncbi:hydrolase 1, exosortase A system-associated [Pelomonas sp. KK5]|uniref:hydrolase 1, exosortase A system-associated n=1 Tax=Pelomonas sp. KK5 TaxID=1855730 RepID=UPI00097CB829|nr:hydrolase 1, exosortase A system-associated [Pelomonas sp. KK5]
MSCVESILPIEPAGARLLGILALPADPAAVVRSATVIIVGGPQYRVGSHRQFTLLARRLASEGIAVLRFDYTGMGDSEGPQRQFTDVGMDVKAAVDALHARLPGLQAVTLWGLCDGASAALLYLDETTDPRIKGLCLINPWVRSEQSFAKAQVKHYYASRLKQAEFWKKLLSGKVAMTALRDLADHLRASFGGSVDKPGQQASLSYQQRMARTWHAFPGPILLMLCGRDVVAQEFQDYARSAADWSGAMKRRGLTIQALPDADHTCSNATARQQVEACTLAWQRSLVTA